MNTLARILLILALGVATAFASAAENTPSKPIHPTALLSQDAAVPSPISREEFIQKMNTALRVAQPSWSLHVDDRNDLSADRVRKEIERQSKRNERFTRFLKTHWTMETPPGRDPSFVVTPLNYLDLAASPESSQWRDAFCRWTAIQYSAGHTATLLMRKYTEYAESDAGAAEDAAFHALAAQTKEALIALDAFRREKSTDADLATLRGYAAALKN